MARRVRRCWSEEEEVIWGEKWMGDVGKDEFRAVYCTLEGEEVLVVGTKRKADRYLLV